MKKNISEMGKILLKRPECEKLVFMSKDKEKEWEDLDKGTKSFIMGNLRETAMKMEAMIAIEMLCHVINELNERIKKIEDHQWEQ